MGKRDDSVQRVQLVNPKRKAEWKEATFGLIILAIVILVIRLWG